MAVMSWLWILLPLAGMGIGALAIWSEFNRQRKALEVLKIYAERGHEPPQAVLDVLNRASSPGGASSDRPRDPRASFAFYLVMALGFGGITYWFAQGDPREVWFFIVGFGITSFVMAAQAAAALVGALTQSRQDGR